MNFKNWTFQGLLESSYAKNPNKSRGLEDRDKEAVQRHPESIFKGDIEAQLHLLNWSIKDNEPDIAKKDARVMFRAAQKLKIGTRAKNIQDIRTSRVAKEKEQSREANKQRHENPQGLFSKMRKDRTK